MKIFYTGVGNRDTPHEYLEKMTVLASLLEKEGCILRSGGAEGADTAFQLRDLSSMDFIIEKSPWICYTFKFNKLY